MDLVGVRDDVPYLFEVKDFRGFAIPNKARQLVELPLEMGLKARDTIAGLLGLLAADKGVALAERWVRAVQERKKKIHVFALLAEDAVRRAEPNRKRDARSLERMGTLRHRLSWLTTRVFITDPLREASVLARHGVIATSLPGAGPARAK